MKNLQRIFTVTIALVFCASAFTTSVQAVRVSDLPVSGGLSQPPGFRNDGLAAPGLQTDLQIEYHAVTGKARLLTTRSGARLPQSQTFGPGVAPEQAALGFLAEYGSLFGLREPPRELNVMKSSQAQDGRTLLRFQQVYQGVPVMGGELIVQLDRGRGVRSVSGEIQPDLDLNSTPRVDPEQARRTALQLAAKYYGTDEASLTSSEPELWIYSPALLGNPGIVKEPALVWRLEVTNQPAAALEQPVRELVLVHARFGNVALNFNQLDTAKYREIYDNNNSPTRLPGTSPARVEGGGPSADVEVNNAYDYLGFTYDFYASVHGRDSLDDRGLKLISTVQYCPSYNNCPYQNAFWNGTQMVFGAGFSSADDVVAHELTHGVTENESGLFYFMQSGAINEAFSDIWGEFIDLTYTNGSDNDTPGVRWQLGEDVPGFGAFRNMADPTLFGDPDKITSANYYCGSGDNGGVHYNSGVVNKTAFLMTDGATFNGYTVAGLGISETAQIFYEVQTHLLTSAADFADLGSALHLACSMLIGQYGITAADCLEVSNAVLATELPQQPIACQTIDAPVCDSGSPLDLYFDSFEDPSNPGWDFQALSGAAEAWFYPPSSNWYSFDGTYATSGAYNLWGYNQDDAADYAAEMKQPVALPVSSPAFLRFDHAYEFEAGYGDNYDGGVLEYSYNGGPWTDAGSLALDNGYTGAIVDYNFGNPLRGRFAFIDTSHGMTSSRFDLSSLAGGDVRFRFRIGADYVVDDWGWFIDDVRIYTCPDQVNRLFLPRANWQDVAPISFHTSFNGDSGGWTPVAGNWYATPIHYFAAAQSGKYISAGFPSDFDNFIYEVRMRRFGKCANCENIIYVRGKPYPLNSSDRWRSYYAFQYTDAGSISVYKRSNDVTAALLNWKKKNNFVATGGDWNALRVVVNGPNLAFFVNDRFVWSGTDPSLTSGWVGVGMYSDNSWDTLAVDWAYLRPYDTGTLVRFPELFGAAPFADLSAPASGALIENQTP
ncbi:MAG: hypothetical protein B6D39_10230 [Anaerolineae bacterium UTCFX2]|jgi:Zn-dependent metalloprotease|nr:M4 family metallopeptidase [Anaerolineales bacterium]OQY89084.1 MAG: hypothetical protein B6D39_10230 [Anaerolineae bacterium UTCFX2]